MSGTLNYRHLGTPWGNNSEYFQELSTWRQTHGDARLESAQWEYVMGSPTRNLNANSPYIFVFFVPTVPYYYESMGHLALIVYIYA